ncbi:oligopeptide/dipeptide ABC transporter ATP-binding protein (plasmid) [Rhizobium etli bv. mimosae str. IE4771]|uniref:Oligopeptide/dipeptide ABC transporter ATP-binding protein n=1 Tax=Rhizobium etli bv. mimosae str. IE4771 TaxID=1432050 RepID=A0A060IHS2_RHIET|nr:ABC transporter ATP-binding protein [Rhizobium sp. IE4771]AIC31111.1 oligopeptide/dipeptide ABC transporter ATP-binding protein [Rhizobium sp. IE4771]
MTNQPLLKADCLVLGTPRVEHKVVDGVSLTLHRGERVGIVGESGSGKSMLMRAVIGLLPPGIVKRGGSIDFGGRDMDSLAPDDMRALRGAGIGLIFQEPMTSLNPALRIGRQMEEGLALHTSKDAAARRAAIVSMLERVGIPNPEEAMNAYPHEFSGGMRQRIMIASVMLLEPALLIADEPTTALDAVVQRDVLELLRELVKEKGTAMVLISHDMAMVAQYTDRLLVMEKGVCVEEGRTQDLLSAPRHDYTKKLLSALPRRGPERTISDGQSIASVKNLRLAYGSGKSAKAVLHGIDLDIHPGEIVALVGGSGSGKTTLGRVMAGLLKPNDGSMTFRGGEISRRSGNYDDYRANCQMIFQDPYSSLDPRMRISDIVGAPLRHERKSTRAERRTRVEEVLVEVGLGPEFADRFPHQLSGGQRQRVAIARAIARRPDLVIADEAVSALDLTVKAQILRLLARLQEEHGFACLFISHDLGVVEQIADRVIVMHKGRIEEQGTKADIFDNPASDYTKRLLEAVPALVPTLGGGISLEWRSSHKSLQAAL